MKNVSDLMIAVGERPLTRVIEYAEMKAIKKGFSEGISLRKKY
jgi:hypothetical protein